MSLIDTLRAQSESGRHKAHGYRGNFALILAAMLGGAFIGIADILMFTAAGPFYAGSSAATPLISGLVFGIGLILVVFAGGELATSAMMALPQAAWLKNIRWSRAVKVLLLVLVGNLLGSIVVGGIAAASGIFGPETDAGTMLAGVVAAKTHKTVPALFFRGIMCNVLVCLAIWAQSRTKNEVAKIILMGWCMFAFVTSGFEHVVANMTTFSLGIFLGLPAAQFGPMLVNILMVGLGNLVGGAFFVGATYLFLAQREVAEH